jgi:hypothetical protein
MKRQFYLDDVERDLLRNALALWRCRLTESETASNGHYFAKLFTLKQIEAMEERLREPTTPIKE